MAGLEDWNHKDLRDARQLLREVKGELARGGEPGVLLSAYPPGTPKENWGRDFFDPIARARERLAGDLCAIQILKDASLLENQETLFVEADLDAVKAGLKKIAEILDPPRPIPESPPSAKSESSPSRAGGLAPYSALHVQPHPGFGRSYGSTLGVGLAWATILAVFVAITFLATKFIPGFGDWLVGVLVAVSKK